MTVCPDGTGPAFPQIHITQMHEGNIVTQEIFPGMSLRQWYAGQALVAILTNNCAMIDDGTVAALAFKQADAMIAKARK